MKEIINEISKITKDDVLGAIAVTGYAVVLVALGLIFGNY